MSQEATAKEIVGIAVERKRSAWTVIFGILSVIAGAIVLGNVVIASVVSVLFIGWMAVFGGVAVAIGSLLRRGDGWGWGLATGTLLVLLGIGMVRNPGVSLLTLTLMAGAFFVAGGILRIVVAFQAGTPTLLLALSGGITVALGLMLFFQFPESALWFLGVILGVELIVDGITTAVFGRMKLVPIGPPTGQAAAIAPPAAAL